MNIVYAAIKSSNGDELYSYDVYYVTPALLAATFVRSLFFAIHKDVNLTHNIFSGPFVGPAFGWQTEGYKIIWCLIHVLVPFNHLWRIHLPGTYRIYCRWGKQNSSAFIFWDILNYHSVFSSDRWATKKNTLSSGKWSTTHLFWQWFLSIALLTKSQFTQKDILSLK